MRSIATTKQFDRDLKRSIKRGKSVAKLKAVLDSLIDGKVLDQKYKDHKLSGPLVGSRECHIEPDWLLIYSSDRDSILLERIGTHSDLFNK